jgi:hypothetical protein
MLYVREYIARIDDGHWILLSLGLHGNWSFLIWGAEPLSGGFGLVEEQTAKDQVAAVAERHWAEHRPGRAFPDVRELQWQLAVEISWFGNGGRMEKQLEL